MADLLDMSVKLFLLYLLAWSLAALSPGPAVMCSIAQSTRHGFRSSLVGIAGLQLGSSLLFIGIALGLGTLLANATIAFRVLRAFGAIYLFYLGARLIGSSFQARSVRESQPTASVAHQSLFVQGLLIQLTNPKALLFVSALLPQFVDSHRSVPLEILILLVATIVIDTVVLSSYAYFAQRGIRSFRTSRFYGWIKRVLGAALVFFGLRLLVSQK